MDQQIQDDAPAAQADRGLVAGDAGDDADQTHRRGHGGGPEEAPGTVLVSFPDELLVATGKGSLLIEELQGASGKCMATKDYLCGCSMEPGTVLT